MDVIELDVSTLPAPEPMTEIITSLSELLPNQVLKVAHHREPFPLYEKLLGLGFCYVCHKIRNDHFHIYITAEINANKLAILERE